MKKLLVPALAIALFSCLVVTGCGKKQEAPKEPEKQVKQQDQKTEEQQSQPVESKAAGRAILMNGRSVMEGWMKHWGYAWEGPVKKNGYVISYKELDASDINNMAGSFAKNVEGLPPGSVVFFKFCFADFDGSNLSTLENIIRKVVATSKEKGLRLVIGNALPVRKQDGNPQMVAEYKKYNAFLEQTASQNPNVYIYDFYGMLAGPDGLLKPEYDIGDSHPNNKAYAALDATFFPFIDGVFAQ